MKALVKKITPGFALHIYHWVLARLGALCYGHPSRHLIVIGVTGTKGKSTTCLLIARLLEAAGSQVGLISTIMFKIGAREWPNETKQTMPGRFRLQRLLRDMVLAGCRYAVVETSSEGIAQFRHLGIDYDVAVFTNLSPEHIESHGSYERYRAAKLQLFSGLSDGYRKQIAGQSVKKVLMVNLDDQEASLFLKQSVDERWGVTLRNIRQPADSAVHVLSGSDVQVSSAGTSVTVDGQRINLQLLGEFNAQNVLLAMAVARSQGIGLAVMQRALEQVTGVPGRMEEIPNSHGLKIFVDYAHEPASLEAVYKTARAFKPKRLIAVLGSQGGGRDKAKRPKLGALAGQYADYVIVTNEDPYDEDPQRIIDDVAAGVLPGTHGTVEKILDRRAAIQKALSVAQVGDLVLITGKGSETVMAVAGGKKIPWDDRHVVRELLAP